MRGIRETFGCDDTRRDLSGHESLPDCERVVVFEAETGSVVWEGRRTAAVEAANSR